MIWTWMNNLMKVWRNQWTNKENTKRSLGCTPSLKWPPETFFPLCIYPLPRWINQDPKALGSSLCNLFQKKSNPRSPFLFFFLSASLFSSFCSFPLGPLLQWQKQKTLSHSSLFFCFFFYHPRRLRTPFSIFFFSFKGRLWPSFSSANSQSLVSGNMSINFPLICAKENQSSDLTQGSRTVSMLAAACIQWWILLQYLWV